MSASQSRRGKAHSKPPRPTRSAANERRPRGTRGRDWLAVEWTALAALFVLLSLLRLHQINGPIDDPHSWRQADTANYALDFYRHGMNLLRPMVCWNGPSPVVALEFPLYEWIVALFYFPWGERMAIARVLSIVCWLVSAGYLYAIVRRWGDPRWARWAAFVYAAAPLGIFYSRAVHIDFATTAAAHAMAYHFLRVFEIPSTTTPRREILHALLGALAGAVAFAIKAPYPVILYVPIAAWAFAMWRKDPRRLLVRLPWIAVPWLALLVWQIYSSQLNRLGPDYSFNPGGFKVVDMGWWYFGTLAQRFDANTWRLVVTRIAWLALTPIGVLACVTGLLLRRKSWLRPGLFEWWLVATAVYLFVFFNLNIEHDYYQIPFLAPLAVFAGLALARGIERSRNPIGGVLVLVIALALAVHALLITTRTFFVPDDFREVAGRWIEAHTSPDDVIVASTVVTEPHDPRLLYRARRHGFSIAENLVTPELLAKFAANGARFLALAHRPSEPGPGKLGEWGYPWQMIELRAGETSVGTLYWVRLDVPSGAGNPSE